MEFSDMAHLSVSFVLLLVLKHLRDERRKVFATEVIWGLILC